MNSNSRSRNSRGSPGGPLFTLMVVIGGLCWWVGLGMGLTGCATAGKQLRPDQITAKEQIHMDPLRVVVKRDGDGVIIESYDARDLFTRANQAFTLKGFSDAIDLYGVLLEEFPGHILAVSARYNKGLAHEELSQVEEAIREYQAILAEEQVSPQDRIDTCFRLVHCLEQTEQWVKMEQVLVPLLQTENLKEEDRLDAKVKLGNSFREQGLLDQAERQYHRVLNHKEQDPPRPLVSSTIYEARAQFGLAEVDRIRFEQHPLRLPQEIMETDLQEKARYFLRAQSGYFKTMAFQNTEMAVAAGFKLGYIFEKFYDQLIDAPVPDELTEEEVEVYFDELRKTIRPLVEKSIFVYQRSIALGQRWSRSSSWLKEAEERLIRLRTLLEQVEQSNGETTTTTSSSSNSTPTFSSAPKSETTPS